MAEEAERKYSVYIALVTLGAVAMYDLAANGNMEASRDIILALLGFAGGRQLIKSFAGK